MADDEERPSWASTDSSFRRWRDIVENAMDYPGVTAVSGGWALQPHRHGEVRVAGLLGADFITVCADTPMQAAEVLDMLLDRLASEEMYREQAGR